MNGSNSNLFENFSLEYDRMIPWETRLLREKPFFEEIFKKNGVRRILDLACGTGKHAIMLSSWGLAAVGLDQSEAMVRRARQNAAEAGVQAVFEQGDFLDFPNRLAEAGGELKPFDAVLILGNSLPHLLSSEDLHRALANIHQVLTKGGLLIIQNRNYDKILAGKNRFMPPNWWRQDGEEMLFFRFLDFEGDRINFNIVTFAREGNGWTFQVQSNRLWPMTAGEVQTALLTAGFNKFQLYGDYSFSPFAPQDSTDLIIVATK